jgi:hypothetical protein
MPRWLVEDPSTVYFVLGLLGLGFAVGWWLKQDERRFLFGLAGVIVLAVVVALLDRFIVTDYEQMVLDVTEMADSVAKKDGARIFTHISDKFQFAGSDKKTFRGWVDDRIKSGDVTELRVWDFESVSGDKREAKVRFLVKGRGNQGESPPYRCIATFALEPDGRWRMTGFELRDGLKDPDKADKIDIPYLGR